MTGTRIHFDRLQRQRLARRAKKHGTTFSQEVQNAVDIYLEVSVREQKQLRLLARAANKSANRMIRKLDETIAYVDRGSKSIRKSKREHLANLGSLRRALRQRKEA